MFVKHISINNFLGITELSKDLGKINHLTGHKGSGKTSLVEAIQKGFTNKSERTEIVRHGEEEATIFIQTDTGLEVERKIRTGGKADYFKVRKPGEVVPSSEKFLKQFISGDIFKPLEFVGKSPTEQAKIILNLLEIPWTMEDIANWFSEIPNTVNYQAHILQIIKQIEIYYYNRRAAINQEIAVLKAQVKGYKDQLPQNYDGEEWREKKVSGYYNRVYAAELNNKMIDSAKNLIEGLESRIATVKAETEMEKQAKKNQMDQKRNEIKEFKQFLENKITGSRSVITQADAKIKQSEDSLDLELERKLQELKTDYAIKKQIARINIDDEVKKLQQTISSYEQSIAIKDQEFANIDQLEEQSLAAIGEKANEKIKTEDAKVGNARKTLDETAPVDIEPLRIAADQVADMQSHLRNFDLMSSMIREKLAPKEEQSKTYTQRIEKGRELPMELLKIAALPIPGITVDSDGLIRIGQTLIDGLSEGEQLELAFRVAKAQAGDLKLICLDGWNKINPSDREWIEKEINEDEFQYIVLETTEGDLEVKIEGEIA